MQSDILNYVTVPKAVNLLEIYREIYGVAAKLNRQRMVNLQFCSDLSKAVCYTFGGASTWSPRTSFHSFFSFFRFSTKLENVPLFSPENTWCISCDSVTASLLIQFLYDFEKGFGVILFNFD